jgi:hypothetical protein
MKDSSSLSILMLFLFEIMQLFVEETKRYYYQYLDILGRGHISLPDVTIQEMYLFLSITVQMGQDQRNTTNYRK